MEGREGPTNYQVDAQGMSLRDYFAAHAMQGFCANSYLSHRADGAGKTPAQTYKDYARSAYALADDMLAVRGA